MTSQVQPMHGCTALGICRYMLQVRKVLRTPVSLGFVDLDEDIVESKFMADLRALALDFLCP